MASATYLDPDSAYKAKLQQGELYRRQSEADARNQQLQNEQDEASRNALTAQNYALTQSHGLQSTDAPRTITDTSMTIGSGGGSGSSKSSSSGSKLPTGGFGSANPQIDGRYMSLVEFQQPNLTAAPPPREVMPQADYTPQDATEFQNAAFARLKDKSGALGKSAIDSLAAVLGSRGVGNSGTFGRGTAREIVNATQPLADLNVEHLGQEYQAAQHARELSEGRAASNFAGNISQRGQDITSQQALNNLMSQIAQLKYQGEIQQRAHQDEMGLDWERLYSLL
jgi:hypothetical protein